MPEPRPRKPPAATEPDLEVGLDAELGAEPDQEYRRPARPMRVRRSASAVAAARTLRLLRAGWPALALLAVAALVYRFATTSPDFTLAGSDDIAVAGASHVPRAQVTQVFAADIGRNIYFIPLQARADALLHIPWVRRATVLRLWPNRLQVQLQERTPVAFARVGSHLDLLDGDGVLLERPARAHYDFPVLTGLAGTPGGPAAPGDSAREERGAQVRRFLGLQQEFEAGGVAASSFSELNLGDPDDIAALVTAAAAQEVLLHLGDHDYLRRYKLYLAHVAEWRQNFPRLRSVDLRYDGQAILDSGPPAAAAAGPAVAKKPPATAKRGRAAARPRGRH